MKRFINMLLCLASIMGATAQDRFYINDFSINPGETKMVEIMLDNPTAFTALQAEIYLPNGLTIEEEDGEYLFDLTDRKARNHTISSTTLSNGAIRILIASQTLKEFSGTSGALVTFNIIADESFSGQKMIELKNVLASEANMTEHALPNTSCVVTVEGYEPPAPTEDRFYINDFSINPGETKMVEIMLDNPTAFTALQAEIYLPNGLTIEEEDGEYLFDLTDRKARDHTISSTTLSNGAIRILIASQTLKVFSGTSGALVTFNVIADESFSGSGVIEIKNVLASEANMTEHQLPNTTCNVTGQGGQPPVGADFTLDPIMAKMRPNTTLQINAIGANNLTWTSSDNTVATVDSNGLVTALKSGLAAITATAANGSSQWCAIFVYLRGDVDEDGGQSIADVTFLIDLLLTGEY